MLKTLSTFTMLSNLWQEKYWVSLYTSFNNRVMLYFMRLFYLGKVTGINKIQLKY